MSSLSFILLVLLITLVPFIWYNYKEIKTNKVLLFIWHIIALVINFLLLKFSIKESFYIELIITSIITYIFDYYIIKGNIDIKKLPKSLSVFCLFFFASIFQLIPIAIFNYDINNLTANQELFLTFFSDFILLIILISIYFKELKHDFKKIHGNFYKMMDIGFKYWILGLVVMMISNIFIGIFITQAKAGNEESVQELIHASNYLSIITIGIIAPIIEELTFRKSFRDVFKNDLAFILLSGLVFGGLHVLLSLNSMWDLFYLIPYSSLGIAFAKIYQKSDNIYTSIFMHMIHNSALTILSLVSMGVIIW